MIKRFKIKGSSDTSQSSSVLSTAKTVGNKIIKFRYLIALIVFILLVVFKVNYSSMGFWENYLDESGQNTVVAGHYQGIRSDEFLVLAPIYLSQINGDTPFSVVNNNITPSGHNVITTLGAPVKNIYTLSKPCHWGFFFLPQDYAFAWYWNMKLILIILLAFELCMIITKQNKLISALGCLWIGFAPAVQWWFAQHVGDITLYMLAMVVTFYYFLKSSKSIPKKILFAFLFSLSCVGYVTPLYPALQVPFGFLAILLMVLIIVEMRKQIKFNKVDVIIIAVSAAFIIAMLLNLFFLIKDSIGPMTQTVYPGKRVSQGGNTQPYYFNMFLTNLFLSRDAPNIGNPCEFSSCYNFLPAVLLALPIIAKRKKGISLKFGIALSIYSVFFALYMAFPFLPKAIAKITLLSYVTGTRAMVAYSFSAMLLSIWALSVLTRIKGTGKAYAAIVSIIVGAAYVSTMFLGLRSSLRLRQWAGVILIFVVLNYLLLRGKKYIFSAIMVCVVLYSGILVNPINIGVGAITNNTLSQEIREVDEKNEDARWIGIGGDYVNTLIYANGADSLGGINNYPDLAKWKAIDPDGKFSDIYNRSAHITYTLTKDGETSFDLIAKNSYAVTVTTIDLKKLNVNFIVSNKQLTEFNDETATFTELYQPDAKNFSIYQVNYK